MTTNPNQLVVEVQKEPCDKAHLYSMRNLEAEAAAARDLKYSSMILWLYLSRNQNGYELALSPKDVEETMGLSERTYRTCKNELMEKGYLVQVKGNRYMFYEKPLKAD